MNTRVLLADDHQIVREGLCAMLEKQRNITVVGTARNGREALQLAKKLKPDVVIMDISMPDLNGIEATRLMLAEIGRVRIIALSMHSDRRLVAEMLRAGASGFLLKECAFHELTTAIESVANGQTYLSPKVTGVVVDDFVRTTPPTEAMTRLTERERQVLQLIAEGRTTKQIAEKIGISPKTVDTHRQQIMRKLDLHSVAELTKYAVREGITSLEP
jgi:DNA-binding NarL/FixJ family response regulator